jgi:hypothetical protein
MRCSSKNFIVCLGFVLVTLPLTSAAGQASDDVRCFSSNEEKQPIQLEARIFNVPQANWQGGYVKYRGANAATPIVFKSAEATKKPADKPWEINTTWIEVLEGNVTGQYNIVSQGTRVYSITYKNFNTKKTLHFFEDIRSLGDNQCVWKPQAQAANAR